MAYWLFKSEPNTWSWDDQLAKADAGEGWDGVRNHQAGNNMKAMEIGDLGFFYHSVSEKQIVGIVDVIEKWHLDPTDPSGKFGMVTVRAVIPLAFWYFSIGGGAVLLLYALWRKDPVIICGQGLGLFIYLRNLYLIKRSSADQTD